MSGEDKEIIDTTYLLPKVTRVEVINHSRDIENPGRVYINMNCKDVELQYQDEGRTLKVFIK